MSSTHDRTGWWVLAALALTATMWPAACVQTGDDPFSELGPVVLAAIGPQVVLPAHADYTATLAPLSASLRLWRDDGDIEPARLVFAHTMLAWQVVDIMRVDPTASDDALSLRDETYSWPVVNPCRVDQVSAAAEYTGGAQTLLVNARGLDALEYLLYADATNRCPEQVPPNSDGTWASLSADELDTARSEYAVVIADALTSESQRFEQLWAQAEPPSLQALLDGLFTLETVLKDRKLGPPLGLLDCDSNECQQDAEGLPDSESVAWIGANLRGFRALFTGNDGQGVDDLLATVDASDISDDLLAKTDVAIALAEAMSGSLADNIQADKASVIALFDAVDAVDELLRADITTLLLLQIPAESAGDND